MRLPIGIQDFTNLREEGYLYVDKTMYMMPLLEGGRFFFARPRRFGKSLLMSTLKAAFMGRKDLFSGLWLENNFDFTSRPMIRLDFSNINFTSKPLDQGIVDWLRIQATEYNYDLKSTNARDAFRELILELSKTAKVAVLIDEYDKPITDYLLEPSKRAEHQAVLKSVYGVLKPMDSYLHTVFLTGVSKIGKLSLFSDLNNLSDISLNADYALICGYTKQEINATFPTHLEAVAKNLSLEMPVLMQQITHWYNGYSWDAINRVYCPFSFLIFLSQKEFKSFWFETGTPTFLVELIRAAQISPLEFNGSQLDAYTISTTNVEHLDPIGLMFQTGYLTIDSIQKSVLGTTYTLSYPNQEVRQAFSSSLLLEYSQMFPSRIGQMGIRLAQALGALDWQGLFSEVNHIFAGVPYEIFPKHESYVHSLLHLMLTSTGYKTQSQIQTSLGRMDILLETFTHFMVFEIKIGGTAKAALKQAKTTQYAAGLTGKPVVLIGVVFDLEKKQISGWAIG